MYNEKMNQFLNRLEEAIYHKIPENVQAQIVLKGMEALDGHAMKAHAPKSLQKVRNLAANMRGQTWTLSKHLLV
jgi:hypothetical protein